MHVNPRINKHFNFKATNPFYWYDQIVFSYNPYKRDSLNWVFEISIFIIVESTFVSLFREYCSWVCGENGRFSFAIVNAR